MKTPAQIIVHSNYEHLRNPSVLPLKVSSEEEEKRQKETKEKDKNVKNDGSININQNKVINFRDASGSPK